MKGVEVPNWLKGLPLAPEFRPTDTEFADPIAYISKIEREASAFGICKVIPPLPKPSKKYVISNLNKSLSKCPELGPDIKLGGLCSRHRTDSGNEAFDGNARAVFTTRHQELGQQPKVTKKACQPQPLASRMQVWQSGEVYTVEQFESKCKAFARSQLGMHKEISPMVIEALFWKAASEKPICVEYANDVPGSGFGEPEGAFQYFHRRRRRRMFNRNSGGSCDRKKYHVNNSKSSENRDAATPTNNSPNSSREKSQVPISSPTVLSNQMSQISKQKGSNTANEMEGTAGWKLSNSPWNLQVIARSPGSLTRFMPDDIPGVTSPMVYIGMLFSWFAWHVEDHELHSLNFLHTGSPKTWYAVPGDYAFSFEEVIRNQAYGGNVDRLAALTLLGEKTTLLSPEELVGLGIPCCRLVQNPGEFVVTFPRAYHVGFSHGFNCGEAANFGTSKWLEVAKEAAVRRAAMNYLPMLSHQQLLYLLTMSFISRVPRSLLPGARNSRLRDRQKEERELSVKKAFIEDILNENNLLTILLGKNSSNRVVLWDMESLPYPSKGSEPCSSIATVTDAPKEDSCSDNKNNQDLLSEMRFYMENVNDLYVDGDDDDLSSDFQVDSGTLPCVACGILGFPLMSVVQPSERASTDLLQDVEVPKPVESHLPPVHDGMVVGFVSDGPVEKIEQNESNLLKHSNGASSSLKSIKPVVHISGDLFTVPDLSPIPKDLSISSEAKFQKGWHYTRGFLRPRIFCLEHAIKIEEMLHPKGGANVLVVCHSDFQKIKAHAAVIAEEIGSPFEYNEIRLDNASEADMNLIDHAINDGGHDERGGDWTSKLNVNLCHCVKVRKISPSKPAQHAMALGGLFSDRTPSSNTFNLKWPSRKFRSKRNLNYSVHKKPSDSIQLENPVRTKPSTSVQLRTDDVFGVNSSSRMLRKEGKLIQYSRRSLKSRPAGSIAARPTNGHTTNNVQDEAIIADCGGPDGRSIHRSEGNICNFEMTGKESSGLILGSSSKPELQNNSGALAAASNLSGNYVPSQVDSLVAATSGVDNVGAQIEGSVLVEMAIEGKASDLTFGGGSEMQHDTRVDQGSEKNEKFNADGDIMMEGDFNLADSEPLCDPVTGSCVVPLDQPTCVSVEENLKVATAYAAEEDLKGGRCEKCYSPDKGEMENSGSTAGNRRKRRREVVEMQTEAQLNLDSYIRSPCEGLRSRATMNDARRGGTDSNEHNEEKSAGGKVKRPSDEKKVTRKGPYQCDIEGCQMSFQTKASLVLHKRNLCPHEGCGKKFSSHKYAMLHQRVHDDDRPLKCPWEGCTMSFKWAWARTEHLRVHTGERPYQCKVQGCGRTFRFVSDYSRHRRKTGHFVT
ncbi:lysine-specific demethylase ELF6 isoform X2 [Diospyros lotus]|uniref:lysine-specific demethylase ELF6 isoform X2 n=1 Tax=Diospyros lotus TaxID=55363 RepID=UPI00224F9C07|nr:lysine-specific demethylase ELF6 isoform X2 [Diospyros lotus]